MGNSHPPIGENPSPHCKLIDSEADFQVYESASGEEFERCVVPHDGSENFEQLYRFRVENRHADLVDLLYAGPAQGFMGCAERGRFEVITERVPYRLETLSGLHPRNALAILRTALRGFRDVYRRHGAVGVAAAMIGVNAKSRVKIWLNRSFAVNAPEPLPGSSLALSPQDQEREMVLSIFDLVDAKTDHDPLWLDLVRLKEARTPRTFDEALNLVDYFGGATRVNIADTVSNLFNKRAYHPAQDERTVQSLVHLQSQERTERLNGGLPAGTLMRKPFEEIDSRAARIEYFPVFQQIPLSHPAPLAHFAHLTQNAQVTASGSRPMIRFSTKTAQVQPISLPQYIPLPVQQQALQAHHPSQVLSSLKPNEVIIQAEPVNTLIEPSPQQSQQNLEEESAPTFKELPVKNEPVEAVSSQPQISQANEPSQSAQIRVVESFEPYTEQQQIHLPQDPPLPHQEGFRLSVDGYEVNVHEVSSQESLHEQLAPLVTEQNKENLPSLQDAGQEQKIVLTMEEKGQSEESKGETSIKNLESLKTVINASLVDTREIKRRSAEEIVEQEELRSGRSLRSQRNTSISYREMRRLLLEELSN